MVSIICSKRDASDGAITPFQAVCTALAATVGTGNIAGVAGAIAIGGPGAIFWMWVSALFGMCTKYAEVTLAVHYREINANGELVGEFANLKKIGADTKIKTNSENTDHCRNAPDKIIYSGVDGFDYLQHKIPLWKFFLMYANGTSSMSHTLLNWCSQSLFEKSFLQSARPLCGKFCSNSVAVACHGALIRAKTPTNCDAHLAKSFFQICSGASFM